MAMKRSVVLVGVGSLSIAYAAAQTVVPSADVPPPAPAPFEAGRPLGVTVQGKFSPISANVKVYGALVDAESCTYDPTRNLVIVPSRGASQRATPNDGFVALLNPDGSVHTPRWIGATRNGLTLNHPFGSEIHEGKLYLADIDGDTADGVPRTAALRMFDLTTGAPAGEIKVPQTPFLNDIAIAGDGTVYGTQTFPRDGETAAKVFRISPAGAISVFLEGDPLANPNGIAIDGDGNIVVANMGDDRVLTFSQQGTLLKTERAAQAGSDGIVIMPDGTKYLSSVRNGGISRLRPGKAAELIATGIPNAASMCYDPKANQLVIPMNPNNAVAIVKLP